MAVSWSYSLILIYLLFSSVSSQIIARYAGTVEYTDSIPGEG